MTLCDDDQQPAPKLPLVTGRKWPIAGTYDGQLSG
jgi:hypothetical protein